MAPIIGALLVFAGLFITWGAFTGRLPQMIGAIGG